MWLMHHLQLPRPKNKLDLLAWAVEATDLFLKHRDPWLPGIAPCSHYSRVLQRFSQQAETVLEVLAESSVARAEHADAWRDELRLLPLLAAG
ncbi:hypothetical protein Y1Q_0004841 [Alligator mississippiensis]|uniref:Uncharacterized protein n=1 Tax=Alligator mississippiensis TaxID=8496 RepID=A0A151NQT3_ALLMI|nr:hypothetical protein Y1Q_0004841 [Alligator mississippiensis]